MDGVVDFPVKPEARAYVEAFIRTAGEPQWLARHREQSLARFAELGFPSRRSEAWRYIDLQPLEREPLLPAEQGPLSSVPSELGFDLAWVEISLLDGTCGPIARRSPLPEGIWIAPTRRAISERPDLFRALMSEGGAQHPFSALNAAFFTDGYVVDIAPGAALDQPIEIVHFASSPGSLHTRSLINIGAGGRATIIESYAGEAVRYWRNDVAAVRLAERASLTHIVLVEEAPQAIHLAQLDATLGQGARFDAFALVLGGNRVRHEANVRLEGDGAHCRLDGAFLVAGSDEANIVTVVDHAAPGGETRELFKGVATGRAHGAFQGRITVRRGAQKVDAQQQSRNLIVGRRAVIDSKPELEILADDVKCSHGAAVGDLDEDAIFYLAARGIAPEAARRMLIEGFLREAVERVELPELRRHLEARLARRLARLEVEA
jgi:Fe-S cluster assembly protein SufD